MTLNVLALGMPQGMEWLVIFGIALLLFGRRLPEVGRSIGQSLVEFKRGLKGVQDDIEDQASRPAARTHPSLPNQSGNSPSESGVEAPEKARVSRSDNVD
ncbi:MAG: twin-arginine translocase TatA/TatE family subunit [Phycisphaeraceae bacterium]|nr:twin-arginine translocase TatA/TatE family subunit [Phycisphaeraceae bacterium]